MGGMGFDTLKRKELMEQFHEIMAQGVHAVEELLRRSRKAGEIVSDQEPAELSWYIVSLIQGVQMRAWMSNKECDIDASVRQVADFIMNGVAGRNQKSSKVHP
jgi:hypothetical protein